jgi:CRP-like cAMP-binding protein
METVPITSEMLELVLGTLGRSAWFQALRERARTPEGSRQVDQIVRLTDLLRFERGEVILKQGDPSDGFFLLLEGSVEVRIESGEGMAVGRLEPPATFGEIGLLLDEPRSATVRAADELLAVRFSSSSFHKMMETVPQFGLETSRYLAQRLKELSKQVSVL